VGDYSLQYPICESYVPQAQTGLPAAAANE
jgi:hypothetical protein